MNAGIVLALATLAALATFDVMALRWGADSRRFGKGRTDW